MDRPDSRSGADSNYNSSSKVKVEYTDPSGIFPLIASDLKARLPLRNLNWNSHSRPLRSIESLFVDLVPDEKSAHDLARATSQDSSSGPHRSSDSPIPRKERRHQIPGLRSTPYLKIYLLRCDDSETYKSTSRKLLREWIKSQSALSPKNSSSNQENHDAFEWLIIHVSPIENSVWPTKASSTVLDKIKSDFNSSSKSSVDRVAQVPFSKDAHDGSTTASAIPAGLTREQFSNDSGRAYEDLLTKMKSLILSSFDSRVRQYEEDIKEKGSQRNIPGWNFCTFFVLKEGLSRGFESVGLLEDALMGYDELSLELMLTMRDQEEKATAGEDASLFRDHTQELLYQAEAALGADQDSPAKSNLNRMSTSVLDSEKKPYRELILANKISIFDFRSYVFARQISVLSRIASLSGSAVALPGGEKLSADPNTLAEICSRAINFIASNSRVVRQDLRASFKVGDNGSEDSLATRHELIENLVASWSFVSAEQILAHTEDTSLSRELELISRSTPKSTVRPSSSSNSSSTNPKPISLGSPPVRASTFANRPQSVSLQAHHDGFTEDNPSTKSSPFYQRKTAVLKLAAQRAELYLISRRALSSIGEKRGWYTGWTALRSEPALQDLDDVSLDDGSSTKSEAPRTKLPQHSSITSSIVGVSLGEALESEASFSSKYQDLSWSAHNLYKFSGDEKSSHAIIADIATMRFQLEDYNAAAAYFHQLAPFYADNDWSELELAILDMYARCLKEMNRPEEYVRIALKLLSKITTLRRHDFKAQILKSGSNSLTLQSGASDPKDHVQSILLASKKLKEPCTVHLRNYFLDVQVALQIEHADQTCGFALAVSLQHIMPETLNAQIKVRLLSVTEGQTRDIWLSSKGLIEMKRGRINAKVYSNVLIPDRYLVDRITIQAENVIFQHSYAPLEGTNKRPKSRDSISLKGPWAQTEPITVWAPYWGFKITATAHPDMHLDQPKAILFELTTGNTAVLGGKLHIKAGSAGLRIHTADAEIQESDVKISDKTQPSVVAFGSVPRNTSFRVVVPYQLDAEMKQILFRSEVTYTTFEGEFICGNHHTTSVLLPLGVNVQDIFKKSELYSKFSVSSATLIPLRILDYNVESTDDFEATTNGKDDEGIYVFVKQPVSMVYRIERKTNATSGIPLETRLQMHIDYQCLDEEIIAAVQNCLDSSLNTSEFKAFQPLLIHHLLGTLREKLPRVDLELIGLLREIGLASYSDFRWDRILSALPAGNRLGLAQWLEEWHKIHQTISLPSSGSSALTRRITIPVDVPSMHILHTACLRLWYGNSAVSLPGSAVAVGEAISAELEIQHTRAWAQSPVASGRPLSFCYELDASPETWLIGGRRRAVFSANEGEVVKFAVLLLPQRAGKLLLPTLDVSLAEEFEGPGGEGVENGRNDGASQWSCEVDYMSQGETVRVVPNYRSTTVAMDPEGGAAWLVEADTGSKVALDGLLVI